MITAVDSHTAGEPTRIVTAGIPPVPGATMAHKRAWLRDHLDHLRCGLVHEPRGHDAIVLAFLTPPESSAARYGVVFANDSGYLGMCGHGAIGVATALVALGMVEVAEPTTELTLDTPAGPVQASVTVEGGKPRSVRLRNVASFVSERDLEVAVPGVGRVRLDVAYGGNWFAILPEDQVGAKVEFAALPDLMDHAMRVRRALQDEGHFGFDPQTGERQVIDHVEIYRELPSDAGPRTRTLTLCPGVAYDRSPCGTGTSAKMAVLWAKGALRIGQTFVNESVIGTAFRGRLVQETDAHGRRAVVPEIEGSAYLTALQQFVFDPDDPLRFGIPAFTRAESDRRGAGPTPPAGS
ncbi:MAG: proline racemase family protein [Planctomycetota bacterium]